MKKQMLKSVLCLTLSAAMIFGEAGSVLAETETAGTVGTETEQQAAEIVLNQGDTEAGTTEAAEDTETAVEAGMEAITETEADTAETEKAAEAGTEETGRAEAGTETVEAGTETAEEEGTETASETEDVDVTNETETDPADEAIDATGYHVVAAGAALPAVSGIAYDTETSYLSWNAAAGADRYEIEIVDPATQKTVESYSADGLRCYIDAYDTVYDSTTQSWIPQYTVGKAYTVKITAKSSNDIYVVGTPKYYYDAAAKKWVDERYVNRDDESDMLPVYADADGWYSKENPQWITDTSVTGGGYWVTNVTYTYYNFQKSQPASASAVINKGKPVTNKRAVTQLSGIALKALTEQRVEFAVSPFKFQESEYIRVEYANNAGFQSDAKSGYFTGTAYRENGSSDSVWADDGTQEKAYYQYSNEKDNTFYVSLGDFLPGDTIYVRARVYNSEFELAANEQKSLRFSAYKTWSYKVPAAVIGTVGTTVTASSVTLRPSVAEGSVTGFQFQKKDGKNWIDLGKYTGYNNYKDSGLTADTTYTYRVRGYSYNKRTKKTVYTGWQKVSAFTWGSSMNLKAAAAGSTSVKLTWNKIKKAEGYEVYRCDTASEAYTYAKDQYEDAFTNMTLVKTIKKAKKSTVSYTDKKLTAGKEYYYVVRAYRTINKKTKSYIQGGATVILSANGNFTVTAEYYTTSGTKKVEWNKMTGIKGYKIEKKDAVTGVYKAYKTLKASKTSYTFPKVTAGKQAAEYRIYPYTKTKSLKSKTYSVTVSAVLPAVKGVKASATKEGIKISWSKVAGADYYNVYRCTSDAYAYDKTRKAYDVNLGNAELVKSVTLNTDDILTTKPYRINPSHTVTEYDDNGRPVSQKQKIGYYYADGRRSTVTNANGEDTYVLYNPTKTEITGEITGTSVVDKAVTVKALVPKTEAERNANTEDGEFINYKKDASGLLLTEDYTLVEGPEKGVTYYYVVVAAARPKNGAAGNNASVKSIDYTKPASAMFTAKSVKKATKLTAKSPKKGQAKISYKKVTGAKGYMIYRASKQKGKYSLVGTSKKTSYTDKTAVAGKTYYYKVAAYTTSETGAYIFAKQTAAKKVKIKK